MKLPVPCKNRKNGCLLKSDEENVKEHEIECEFRLVDTPAVIGGEKMFKDLLSQAKGWNTSRKWVLNPDENMDKIAYRNFIEPDGHIFRVLLHAKMGSYVKAFAMVFGGETVAKRYRVEMRLTSNEEEFTNTHHGPVFSADVKDPCSHKESYWIPKEKFAIFNHGFDHFGDHNKDKNGEVIIPMTVKIIKKELNIPKMD